MTNDPIANWDKLGLLDGTKLVKFDSAIGHAFLIIGYTDMRGFYPTNDPEISVPGAGGGGSSGGIKGQPLFDNNGQWVDEFNDGNNYGLQTAGGGIETIGGVITQIK